MVKLPAPALRQRFRRNLLAWYRKNGRDLPWRNTDDPYHILVSEVMLHQTQVARVAVVFDDFLARFPTPAAMAASSPGDVITAKTALVHMEEKVGKLGLTLYKSTEIRWTNQRGEFVRSRISISIVY